jgi:hypothetical protein
MKLHRRVDHFLRISGLSPTRFGLLIAHDPNLVRDLRAGRRPRPALLRRIEAILAGGDA